ncbi:hypothetical protein M9458_012479, partial [Cirrhinus mrigala]
CDLKPNGESDELLHAIGSASTTSISLHGYKRIQHRPVPAGPDPAADARRSHESIR